jgi:hypothetical protein
VERLAAALPRGLQAYWGISSNALDTMFTERLSIDDAVVNLGATDDERKAWADAMARARAVVAQVDGGMVGGVALLDLEEGRQAQVVSMRVRDAAAFRRSLKELAPAFERSGAGRMSIREEGEALTMRVEPNAARLKEAIEVLTRESMDDEAMESFDKAMQPSMVTMRFRGNEVLMAQDPSGNAIDAAKLGDDKATDIRKELVTGSWGTLDWFIAMDLRDIIAKAGDAADDEELAGALKGLRGGKPLMFRISQGVQGNTARLSAQANLTEIREVAQTVEKAIKAAEAKSPAQDGDHDEDEDEQEGAGMTSPASAP